MLAVLLASLAAYPQSQSQSKPSQKDIPDAPSAVRPPQPVPPQTAPVPSAPAPQNNSPASDSGTTNPPQPKPLPNEPPPTEAPTPEPAPSFEVKTVPEGSVKPAGTRAQEQLYKITSNVNQVIVPVRVTDDSGRLVSGLLPKDFTVYENGVAQKMNFFTSDPFSLSVAVVLDLGMPDAAVEKVKKTFPALQGAFSQFDEIAVYTYSSTTAKFSDFSGVGRYLSARLNELKDVTGRNNGPPVTGGPFGPQGPTINGRPVDPSAPIVYTPPKESHVLNDAVLAAAVDLSKRDRTRRKVIFIISDGREYGSSASYKDVLRVLLSNGIMVYGIGTESAAIPGYSKLSRLHLPHMGYSDILPKYANATGGEILNEFSQSAIDDAYSRIVGEARNQYTLGYLTHVTPSSSYRDIEVRVDRPGCKNSDLLPCVNVYAKSGYYPLPRR